MGSCAAGCCTSNVPVEIKQRRRTRNTEPRRRTASETKTFGEYPVHVAIIRKNEDYLRQVLSKVSNIDLNELDHHGYTPCHLCVLTGWTKGLEILLEKGANPLSVSKHGWSLIQDAVALTQGECLYTLLTHISTNNSLQQQGSIHYQSISSALNQFGDFECEMVWDVSTWMPFIAKYCPKDTIRIYKKGNMIRIDDSISQFNFEKMEWEFGPRCIIFKPRKDGLLDVHEKVLEDGSTNVSYSQYLFLPNMSDISEKILRMDNEINSPSSITNELIRDALLYSILYDLKDSNPKLSKKLLRKLTDENKKDLNQLLSNQTLAIEEMEVYRSTSWLGEVRTSTVSGRKCRIYEIPSLSMISNFRTLKLNSKMKEEFHRISQQYVARDASLIQTSVARDSTKVTRPQLEQIAPSGSSTISNSYDIEIKGGGYATISKDHILSKSVAFDQELTKDDYKIVEPSQKNVIQMLLSLGHTEKDDDSDDELSQSESIEDTRATDISDGLSIGRSTTSIFNDAKVMKMFTEIRDDCDKMAMKMIECNKYNLNIQEIEYKKGMTNLYEITNEMMSNDDKNNNKNKGNDNNDNDDNDDNKINEMLFASKIRELWDWERTKQSAKLELNMYEKNQKFDINDDLYGNDESKSEKKEKESVPLEEFDLKIDEMVAVLDVISPKVKYANNLKEFFMIELPNDGFPMKIQIPFYNLVTAKIKFINFKRKNIDPSLFNPEKATPNEYK